MLINLKWDCFCDQYRPADYSDVTISPRPQPPRQPGQDEGDEDGGEQVDGVVVQDGFPTDPLGGGRLVAHHLPDARVET